MTRHRLFVLVRLALSVGAVFLIVRLFLLPALRKNSTNLSNLIHINIAFLLLGLALEVGSLLAYARLTQVVLPGPKRRLFTLLRIDMSTFAVSHLVPGGSVAGAALGYRLLDYQGVSYTDASFAIGTQAIGSAVVLNVVLWAALIVSIPIHGVNHHIGYLYKTAAVVGAFLLTLSGGLIFFLTIGQERATRIIHWIGLKLPFIRPATFESALDRLGKHLAALARDRRLLTGAIVWAAANWALDAASLWVFLRAFGVSVLAPYLLVAYGLAYVLAVVPITPSGLGIVETVLIGVLSGFGFASSTVGLGVLSYRVVNFLLPIPVGAASYLSLTLHRAVLDTKNGHSRVLRGQGAENEAVDPTGGK